MGIAYSTFKEWKKKYSAFSAVLKKTKDVVDTEVENALYQKALKGDTTAMIFWLKNRKAKYWRDHPELSEDGLALANAKKLLDGVVSAID